MGRGGGAVDDEQRLGLPAVAQVVVDADDGHRTDVFDFGNQRRDALGANGTDLEIATELVQPHPDARVV